MKRLSYEDIANKLSKEKYGVNLYSITPYQKQEIINEAYKIIKKNREEISKTI